MYVFVLQTSGAAQILRVRLSANNDNDQLSSDNDNSIASDDEASSVEEDNFVLYVNLL